MPETGQGIYICRLNLPGILRLDRFQPSTKICSCGAINETLTLNDRVWTCQKCKAEHDRDILAARNILRYCFQKQFETGQGLPESTLSEKSMPSVTYCQYVLFNLKWFDTNCDIKEML